MTSSTSTEIRLRDVLATDLDGATGPQPRWVGSAAHRRATRDASSASVRWAMGAAAVVALVVVGAVALQLRSWPTRQGGVAAPMASASMSAMTPGPRVTFDGSDLVIAGQAVDPGSGATGPAVVVVPGTDGRPGHTWIVPAAGAWQEGPVAPRVPAPPDATLTETWATDGRTLARLVSFGTTRIGDGNAIAYREIWTAPLDPTAEWRKVATIDDLIDMPASIWDPSGRLVPMPDGGYVVTNASSLLIVRPDGTLDAQALPNDRMVIAPATVSDRFVVASVAGARTKTANAPFRAMLWSRDGQELPIADGITGIDRAARSIGLAWVQVNDGPWSPLLEDGSLGAQRAAAIREPVTQEPLVPTAITPTGTWTLGSWPAGSPADQTWLFVSDTDGVVAQADGSPTGAIAWFEDGALFTRRSEGVEGTTDGGTLVRMSIRGVDVFDEGVPPSPSPEP